MKMNYLARVMAGLLVLGAATGLTSCFEDDDSVAVKYKEWRQRNEQYVLDEEARMEGGVAYYSKIVPSWAPNAFSLVHWHNDRSLTQENLSPMDNSTVQITYELFDIDGKKLSDSFSNADSLYTSKPNQNIVGMWATLTNMHVGDSVTIVMPSQAGYGEVARGEILPYSTLIYNVKLRAITAYEVP